MNHTNDMHSEKSLPVTTCIEDTLKLINHGIEDDDDDDSEEDFILLQMPLVPKEFTVKQEIKTEEEDEVKIEYLYPEQVEIIEEYEDSEVDVPLESNENNEVNLEEEEEEEEEDPQEPSPLKDLQEETRKISYEEQKAELEQKIRDIKTYYSAVSSMCNKLDVFIKSADEKLVYTEQLNNKHKKVIGKSLDPTNSKSSGWVHVFGAPYFKDRQFFYGPKNYDVLQKEQRNEININSLPNTHLWKPYEKQKVAQAIKDIEIEKRIERCKRRISELSSELHNVDEERRLEMEDELSDVRERRKLIKKLSLAELVHGRFDEYDWLKISVTDLGDNHSPEEVRSMWFAYLHPDINKDEWTAEEMEMLKTLAERNNFQNWSLIAEQLGTGRSEFQCVRFYQMNLNEQLTRSKWTPEEDLMVQQMVERYRVGTFIPWARVAAMVKGRTKVQVFNRWKYCLEPSIRKGRFTEEEDLMILAAMKWYGRNFQQISRFIPGRTPIQLRDRYNASLENTEQFTWDEACDEKLVEMVEEFGQSAWAAVARSFSGFSRVQIRHRYFVIEKWRETHGDNSFPPIRYHTTKRNYDPKLEDILGSYVNISEEKATIMGDKPLFQIQNKLGLQHKKKRARSKARARRTKYTTALDALYLKHFSVSYYCQRSTNKRVVDKEVIEDDGNVLKSLLTIFNAVLNIPSEQCVKKNFGIKYPDDLCLLEYLRNGTLSSKKTAKEQKADENLRSRTDTTPKDTEVVDITDSGSTMSYTEVAAADTSVTKVNTGVASTDLITALLPKKCNYSLANYINNKESMVPIPVQVRRAASSDHYRNKKSSAASVLSSMLPQKCSYSWAESFMGNVKKRKGNSSFTARKPLRVCREMSSVSSRPSSPVDIVCESGESSRSRVDENNVLQSESIVVNSDPNLVTGDSSVPIDNGITIRWCLIPNYSTLIACKTMLLSVGPLLRTVDGSRKREKAEKLRKEDKAFTKLTLENIVKSDDPLALQEMLTEFDVDTSQNHLSGKSSFTYVEADALCKQRFVSLLLFPALVSIRNLKICDDVFELANDSKRCKNQYEENIVKHKVDSHIVKFVDKLTAGNFRNYHRSTLKENVPVIDSESEDAVMQSNSVAPPEEVILKKKRGRKRKVENIHAEETSSTSQQTDALPKKKYASRSPKEPTRKSERPHKPASRLKH